MRHLTDAGLLEQGHVRTGESGALEKPYRSTGLSWWLSNPQPEQPLAPIEAFNDELREAGPDSVQTHARFALHLSPDDIAELDRRIGAILDEYIQTDDQRRDQPLHGGIFVLHRLAEESRRRAVHEAGIHKVSPDDPVRRCPDLPCGSLVIALIIRAR